MTAGGHRVRDTDGSREGQPEHKEPYAMSLHRCTHSAAGGTSQRFNPGPAKVRRVSRMPSRASGMVLTTSGLLGYQKEPQHADGD